MNKTDIIIPLNKGSHCGDLELLYALRSVEKHLKGVGRLVIISDYLPRWINAASIEHIPFKEHSHKQANISGKILAAIADDSLSDDFLFMNDDHFLLQDTEAGQFPFIHSGDLSTVREKGAGSLLRQLTATYKPTTWFDGHFPILYHKTRFKEAICAFSDDVIIKSAYCNYWNITGEYMVDRKINSNLSYERIKEEITGRLCFSVGDYGCNAPMKRVWTELYPQKSRYELY